MASIGSDVYGAGIFGADSTVVVTPPVSDPPPTPSQPEPSNPNWTPIDPGISLIGTNGDEIILQLTGEDYGALKGVTGIGIPARVLTIFEGASDGGTVRYARAGVREIDLPIGIFGRSRGEVGDRQRRLASALRPRKGAPPARMRFTIETGEVFETVVYYATGAETQIGDDGTTVFCRWPITLQCPDPYWTSTIEQIFTLGGRPGGIRSLVTGLGWLAFSSAQVIGSVKVDNPGDVESDLLWDITGPGGPFTATSSTGESFTFADTLNAGETVHVNTATGTVVDDTGANRYSGLGDAPRLFKLPDGTSTVEISMDGTTADSRVVGRFRARREVMY